MYPSYQSQIHSLRSLTGTDDTTRYVAFNYKTNLQCHIFHNQLFHKCVIDGQPIRRVQKGVELQPGQRGDQVVVHAALDPARRSGRVLPPGAPSQPITILHIFGRFSHKYV
jgi:hypothetical protein